MRSRSVIVSFGALTACLAAGYGVIFSMLDDFRDEYGIGEGALGVIIGIGFFSGFVAQVLIAPLADRGHARRLVLLGLFLDVIGVLAMALATAFVPLFLGRLVMGIGIGMTYPAVRRIVILAEPERLGHNLGLLLAIDVGGFAAGPAVSAVLVGPFGIPTPFFVIAVATMCTLPLVLKVHVAETEQTSQNRLAFDLLRIKPFAGAVALGSAVFLMIGAFDALWALVMSDLGTRDWVANIGISVFALPLVLLGAVGGRLAQRIGPFRVGTVGLLIAAGFMFAYGYMPSGGLMLAVAIVHAVSDGLTVSSTGVAVGLVVPRQRQAGAQGLLGGFQTLTAGVTAVVAGVLYEHAGQATAYGVSAAAMVVLVLIGVLLARGAWGIRGAPGEVVAGLPVDPAAVLGTAGD